MFFWRRKKKKEADNEKQYALNVITKHEDDGYSSHWHGWSSKWRFTHAEAIAEIEKIKHLYDEIEMIELTS